MSEQVLSQKKSILMINSKNRKIPEALDDLNLNNVFINYSTEVYKFLKEEIRDCYIADFPDGPCCFVDINSESSCNSIEKCFSVRNNSGEEYWLLQIDKGVIKKSVKKCDCAVMNRYSIAFIEFKANMTTENPKTMLKEYQRAQEQLKSTITLFRDVHGKSLSSIRDLNAYVCLRKGYPKFGPLYQNISIAFKNDTGIPLSFDGEMHLTKCD